MTLIIVSGGIDLSVGSVVALCWRALGALTVNAGLAAAGRHGGGGGSAVRRSARINGLMIAGFRMAPFIVTLGMMGMARGSAKLIAHSETVNVKGPTWLDLLMRPFPLPQDPDWFKALVVAPGVWMAVMIAVGMSLVMSRSVFGRYCLCDRLERGRRAPVRHPRAADQGPDLRPRGRPGRAWPACWR
jgi:ribose transport system permease protein